MVSLMNGRQVTRLVVSSNNSSISMQITMNSDHYCEPLSSFAQDDNRKLIEVMDRMFD